MNVSEYTGKWALNTKKGTTINHPQIGSLVGGIASPIKEEHICMAKHMYNVVIFDGFED